MKVQRERKKWRKAFQKAALNKALGAEKEPPEKAHGYSTDRESRMKGSLGKEQSTDQIAKPIDKSTRDRAVKSAGHDGRNHRKTDFNARGNRDGHKAVEHHIQGRQHSADAKCRERRATAVPFFR